MLNFSKKLKEQPMPKFDHDSFYIWDVEAFSNPKDYTPKNEEDINRVIGLLENCEDNHALPKNPKFDQFATLCQHPLAQYQQNFDEYTPSNFRNIVSDVSRYQEHHNNCYIRFDTEDFDFQQLSETVFIFQKACEQLGLMMVHSSAFEPVVFYPNGKTRPKHIASQLETFVLSEKDQGQDSDELPSNKAKVQKMFKPKFDKLAHDFGFTPIETTHPYYEELTKYDDNVYIGYTPISYIILKLEVDKQSNGEYKIYCNCEFHSLKVEEILANFDRNLNLRHYYLFNCSPHFQETTASKIVLDNQLREIPKFIKSVIEINTYEEMEANMVVVAPADAEKGMTKSSLLDIYFQKHVQRTYFRIIILMKLMNDPLYEFYKTKFIELRESSLDWQSGKVSSEEQQKVRQNWAKLIEILDNLPESELEAR